MPGTAVLDAGLGALGLSIAMLVLLLVPSQSGRGVRGSLASIEQRYARQQAADGRPGSASSGSLPGWPAALARRLSHKGSASALQRRLDLAGNPPRWGMERILAAKGVGLLILALLGLLYGRHSAGLAFLLVCAGGATGFFLPDLLLYNTALKRQARIQKSLPDALDMLTVCVEAGLGFDAALAQVARNSSGPLAAEFARALQEMQIGKSRSEALRAMAGRTTVPEMRAFLSALVHAGELGIAIAQVLREQAREMRLRRRQRAEEKAQKVPVKILFPLIAFLFPALIIIVMGPGVITIAHSLLGK
jgi:tight adherence protein C